MDSEGAVQAVAEWVRETVPEIVHAYTYAPEFKDAALPDAVVELLESSIDDKAEGLGLFDIQQGWFDLYRIGVSFMVDGSDPEYASETLRGFESRLKDEAVKDGTLGGRVGFRSPYIRFDFTPPLVEYEDGTRGREMTLEIVVGDYVVED
jgi:hypothetical protein